MYPVLNTLQNLNFEVKHRTFSTVFQYGYPSKNGNRYRFLSILYCMLILCLMDGYSLRKLVFDKRVNYYLVYQPLVTYPPSASLPIHLPRVYRRDETRKFERVYDGHKQM